MPGPAKVTVALRFIFILTHTLLEILSGDRVQWFRAEAEMQCWQEQGEQKLSELLRTSRSFAKMKVVWAELAVIQPSNRRGAQAYARQKAAMYERRASEACSKLRGLGYGHLLEKCANLVSFVQERRKKEAEFISQAVAV
jgi:hypothetical protein